MTLNVRGLLGSRVFQLPIPKPLCALSSPCLHHPSLQGLFLTRLPTLPNLFLPRLEDQHKGFTILSQMLSLDGWRNPGSENWNSLAKIPLLIVSHLSPQPKITILVLVPYSTQQMVKVDSQQQHPRLLIRGSVQFYKHWPSTHNAASLEVVRIWGVTVKTVDSPSSKSLLEICAQNERN